MHDDHASSVPIDENTYSTTGLGSSFVDSLLSYKRSQTFLSASNVATYADVPIVDDVEAQRHDSSGNNEDSHEPLSSLDPIPWMDGFEDDELQVTVKQVTEDMQSKFKPQTSQSDWPLPHRRQIVAEPRRYSIIKVEAAREITPLLSKRPSASSRQDEGLVSRDSPFESSQKTMSVQIKDQSKSTFGQTLFNSIAILVGIGMLSEPLAFSYAGWFGGTMLLVLYALVACYTAILLNNILSSDPRIRTYADIGRKAFGPGSATLTSTLFCLELFSLSVVLVTLFADSLEAVLPAYSKDTYKLLSMVVILPTTLLPLSILAFSSVIGIVSSLLVIFVILFDGFSRTECPGSLQQPCTTFLMPSPDLKKIGMAFGLFMAGFSGHAVVPSLARDMQDPSQFGKMISWAFIASTLIYALVGATGYLMFGTAVSDEISRDLLRTAENNPTLNKLLLWMLVIMPITKFALGTRPLNTTIEGLLRLDTPNHGSTTTHLTAKRVWIRFLVAASSILTSILIPEFSSMMSFLGSFSAFAICIIGPVAAHLALNKGRWWDYAILGCAVVMAVWGTITSLL